MCGSNGDFLEQTDDLWRFHSNWLERKLLLDISAKFQFLLLTRGVLIDQGECKLGTEKEAFCMHGNFQNFTLKIFAK